MSETKWEYKIESARDAPMYDWRLNELGELGWELFHISSDHFKGSYPEYYFKRQVPTKTKKSLNELIEDTIIASI